MLIELLELIKLIGFIKQDGDLGTGYPPSLARISLCPPELGTGLETRASEGGRPAPAMMIKGDRVYPREPGRWQRRKVLT